jgi:oligopeptide transport system substrate-binding protein
VIRRNKPIPVAIALTLLAMFIVALGLTRQAPAPVRGQQADVALRVLGGSTQTWDPARAGDTASAAVLAQVFEGLTALDPNNNVKPALAQSWTVSADGKHIDFALREGAKYSDGTPIAAQHFVDSWFRLLDPQHPAPLVSLLNDVAGATDYLVAGGSRDAVGLHAQGNHLLIDLARPASYFVAVTTSPSLAVVPPSMFDGFPSDSTLPAKFVASGAYVPVAADDSSVTLKANANYWAGKPLLDPVEIVTDTKGESAIDMFEAGTLDYTPIGAFDAAWIRFDRGLGGQLRQTPDLEVQYYGFDTRAAPFNDVHVRQAFAKAVDWDRIVRLAGGHAGHSIVPSGLPTGADDYRPAYDPAAARDLLAMAGFPGGAGFPKLALVSNGFGYEPAVAAELKQQLGIDVTVEIRDFNDLLTRQQSGIRDAFWNQIWAADYPHPNDFLGLLLETGSTSNEGGWSDPNYDEKITAAAAETDPAAQASDYAAAQQIVKDQVPVVPVESLQNWALSRDGLLGALPSGAGFLRFAGMAWTTGR